MYNKIFVFLFCFAMLACVHSQAQCNNVNLADGRPQSAAFASESGSYADAWRAFDVGSGYDQTHWGQPSNNDTAYIGIDLGQPYNICSMYFLFGSFDYPTDFKIQGSNDTTASWTDLRVVTGNTQSEMTVDNLLNVGSFRYVRMYMTHRVYDWSN